MKKFLAAVLGGVAASVMLFASPAFAMPSNAPVNYVTVWENIGYAGAAYPISDDWTGCRAIPTFMNDRTSSVANHSASPARNIRFFKDGGCSGSSYLFYAGTFDGQLSSAQGNDSYSSYKFE